MDDKIVYLTRNSTAEEVISALESVDYKEYPVVESQESMTLVGLIDRVDLEVIKQKMI
jgi:CBS domain-containing protein